MTERLYYNDSYLTRFGAEVVDAVNERRRIYLDRTAFYPTSGGQPHDLGTINGIAIAEVVDEQDGRIAHILEAPLNEAAAECQVNWGRRFDHMQQHTGQHLLSAILVELFGAQTVSFHLGAESSTIDIARALLDADEIRRTTERANEVVFQNRAVTVEYRHSTEDLGLRKPTEREGELRIVSIEGLDRSACGGTHVRATGEIGPILVRRLEKIRGNIRMEFLCGMRAVRRAQADYEALASIGRAFSATLDETPELVKAQIEKLQEMEKSRRKLALELAQARGRQLFSETGPGLHGLRVVDRRVAAISEELRAEAQAFAAGSKAVFIATTGDPPAVLMAVSSDSGINAGQVVKDAVTRAGGRGGGTPTVAQGSVPSLPALESVIAEVKLRTTGNKIAPEDI